MDEQLGSTFPRAFIPAPFAPPAIVLIYLDWLLQEIDARAEEQYPILKTMRGHRRREIIEFLESMPDWTIGILNTKMVV